MTLTVVHSRHHGELLNPKLTKTAKWARSVIRTVPRICHPLVRRLFEEMKNQRATYQMVSIRSGVSVYTLWSWRRGRPPDLTNLIACFNSLGMTLIAVHVATE